MEASWWCATSWAVLSATIWSALRLRRSSAVNGCAPWHFCDECGKKATVLCSECPNSFCGAHAEGQITSVGPEQYFCGDHIITRKKIPTSNHQEPVRTEPVQKDLLREPSTELEWKWKLGSRHVFYHSNNFYPMQLFLYLVSVCTLSLLSARPWSQSSEM